MRRKIEKNIIILTVFTFLILLLGACGQGTPTANGPPASARVTMVIRPVRQLIALPPWISQTGVTAVTMDFANGHGYINDAKNVVVWTQDGWRFQVLGPLTVANPTEADTLYSSFESMPLKGHGVMELIETHKQAWKAQLTWETTSGRYNGISFPMTATNTGLMVAAYQTFARYSFNHRLTMQCVTHLTTQGQAIIDRLACPIVIRHS